MPRYALLSKGSYIETVQPPSMANRKTCQLKGFPTGELAPEASEEVQLSSGARFKGVNLAPKEKVRSETGNTVVFERSYINLKQTRTDFFCFSSPSCLRRRKCPAYHFSDAGRKWCSF